MQYDSIIGTLGVSLILIAYFFNSFGWLHKNKLYFLLNIVGAGLACCASLLIHYWPFVILEGVWTLVSVAGLIQVYKPAKV